MKNLTPITRKEMFMAKAAGQDVTPPEPITREEMFLSDIAEHEEGQSSGGSGDVMRVTFTVALYDESTDTTTYGADKTFMEIKEAVENGAIVMGVDQGVEGYVFYPLAEMILKDVPPIFVASAVFQSASGDGFKVLADNSVQLISGDDSGGGGLPQ